MSAREPDWRHDAAVDRVMARVRLGLCIAAIAVMLSAGMAHVVSLAMQPLLDVMVTIAQR